MTCAVSQLLQPTVSLLFSVLLLKFAEFFLGIGFKSICSKVTPDLLEQQQLCNAGICFLTQSQILYHKPLWLLTSWQPTEGSFDLGVCLNMCVGRMFSPQTYYPVCYRQSWLPLNSIAFAVTPSLLFLLTLNFVAIVIIKSQT